MYFYDIVQNKPNVTWNKVPVEAVLLLVFNYVVGVIIFGSYVSFPFSLKDLEPVLQLSNESTSFYL